MYFGHYIFMDQNTLAKINFEFIPNVLYLETIELDKESERILKKI